MREHLGWFGVVLYWLCFVLFPVKLAAATVGGVGFVFVTMTVTV